MLDVDSNQANLPEEFFEVIDKLIPFADDLNRVFFFGDCIGTSKDKEHMGTLQYMANVPDTGCFNIKQMFLLRNIVKTIDLSAYPKPCLFYGDSVRGVIVGIVL